MMKIMLCILIRIARRGDSDDYTQHTIIFIDRKDNHIVFFLFVS